MKRMLCLILIYLTAINLCSCALFKTPLDKRTGFSNQLMQTETHIRNEDWAKAKTSLKETRKTWSRLKPMLQIDIDHDYVNDIEDNFTKLNGYIETQEKPDSLASILLIRKTWDNIGSL